MSILQAIILGIVQGATEFLPVSSSGHLSLAQHMMGLSMPGLFFDVMLHLGTLIAVIFVYRNLILRLLRELVRVVQDLVHREFHWKQMSPDRRLLMMLIIGLLPLFLLFLPVPGTGHSIKDYADIFSEDSDILVEGFSFLGTSALLYFGIQMNRKVRPMMRDGRTMPGGRRQYNPVDALSVGVGQVFAAVFPGLSRSGTTLSVGLMRGINKQSALDYSFVMGIPAILAAVILETKDAVAQGTGGIGFGVVICGLLSAMIVGFLAIKLLKWIVSSNKLAIFVVYTGILGVLTIIIGIIEHVTGFNLFSHMPL